MNENLLREAVFLLVRFTEAGAALVIFSGALISFCLFLYRGLFLRKPESFVDVRLVLGRFLALGLEFQLASDLLRTSVAPTFEEIGKLAAVAAIRTALNFFLSREIRTERTEAKAGEMESRD
ncbi:MAG: DUF1622 domain-containing protein [Bdellovibrionota bacterium]